MYENFKNDEYNLSDNSVIDSGNDSDGGQYQGNQK